MRFFNKIILSLSLFLLVLGLQAQSLQSPAEFLGYAYGSRFTFHDRVVAYTEYLCENSPYLQLIRYGQTTEGRQLLLVMASHPDNLAKAEQIRTNNLKLAGFQEGSIEGKALPIVWLNFNIHGNESAGTTAALLVLYDLATQSKPKVKDWLKGTMVLIDPCVNPDGYARYVNWYQQKMAYTPNANPLAQEHDEPWPGGRFNHYLFDLNRDWAWQTQIENQQRIKLYQQWKPHVHVDLHEMGYMSPYFFGPAAKPIHEDVTTWQRNFQQITADNHKKYFDAAGWLYFTQEVYDLFYPSYGDTYPMFNGAVGFTYEQGGSGRAGVQIARYGLDTLTITDRYTHHYTAALSTIEVTYQNGEKLLQEFKKYFEDARKNPAGIYKTYLIKGNQNAEKISKFLAFLDKQQIQYAQPKSAGQNLQGFEYFSRKKESFKLEKEDIVINTAQNQARLIKVLFEPETKLEDSLTYDLTAWALPYAHGLKTYALTERIEPQNNYPPLAIAQQNQTNTKEQPVAYLLPWQSVGNAQFLQAALQQKLTVKMSEAAFTLEGKSYAAGTLIFLREHKNPQWSAKILALAKTFAQTPIATYTGQATNGKDLGSEVHRLIKMPKIALYLDSGVETTNAGSLWFFLEQDVKIPFTAINKRQLRTISMNDFDVLILPSGRYEAEKNQIYDFIAAGGKVITMDEGLDMFVSNNNFKLKEKEDKSVKREGSKTSDELQKYQDRNRERISKRLAGAIYQVNLDTSHPLSFGLENPFFIMKQNAKAYQFLGEGAWNVGIYPQKEAYVSGFAGQEVKPKLEQSLAIGVEYYKRGKVVYFSDNPVFRGFWENGKLLLINAILLL